MVEYDLPACLRVRGGCRSAPTGDIVVVEARLKDEVADWLAENVTGRWEARVGTPSAIVFDDFADAALFKFRWL
ncbi:hypothetical protein P7B04_26160 [Sphingobium yanoikuyae]|jgi:hypothetical protein|uniref:hypothetical protein n=1 Tax=Sphingobium yanoikuyae TaxID=13690 RepID=UPI00037CE8FD|nr:hypothetical protein [Sphingobium yanoikuyae]MDG2516149.1 hypothetical protein [Sphingobium yanoikuyae]RSU67281.1 hypothetical protein BRX37_25485 [Sphingomonas sp. S-NIH.Pt3_0716]